MPSQSVYEVAPEELFQLIVILAVPQEPGDAERPVGVAGTVTLAVQLPPVKLQFPFKHDALIDPVYPPAVFASEPEYPLACPL